MKIEIDGKEIEAEAGSMIIQVADQHGIAIPRFCYHNKLSIAANCRMCLVQVQNASKPLPACATPISEGMKVSTTSAITTDAQKAVMEYLLINHPLDCPICDQGGECELQDVSFEYGKDHSEYDEEKRVVIDQNLGPLVATDLTRCIQCTRCVRFGTEIAGDRELGATGRGEFMKIETFVAQHVNSEVSGNIIDLCPVGALTSKPFRFKARAWELIEYPYVSPHDCIGSNLYLHVLRDKVLRVVPKAAEDINEVWLSDRDRFSYEALTHEDRLRKPMVNKNGKWGISSWVEALKFAMAGIKLSQETFGNDQLGVLASPNSSLEEFYILQQLARGLGTANIDHRLRQLDFSDQDLAPLFPNLGIKFQDLETQDMVLLIGSNIHKEQPIAGLKLRKMTTRGGKVCAINPVECHYNFPVAKQEVVVAANLALSLAGIVKELLRMLKNTALTSELNLLQGVETSADQKQIAAKLLAGKDRTIILGQQALMHPRAAEIKAWTSLIAKITNSNCGFFSDGSNAAGAWIAGCVPHRMPAGIPADQQGKNALEMLRTPLKCYILYAIEPEFDSLLGAQALETIAKADFVVAISAYQSDSLLKISDVILPLAQYAEISGTYLNVEGKWQTTQAVIPPYGESRPGWKILRVLGNLAQLPFFEYASEQDIRDALVTNLSAANLMSELQSLTCWKYRCPTQITINPANRLLRIAPLALYSSDSITRRAKALQHTKDAHTTATIEMNQNTANSLHVAHGDLVNVTSAAGATKLTVEIASVVPDFSVVIFQAQQSTNYLGAPYSYVEVTR